MISPFTDRVDSRKSLYEIYNEKGSSFSIIGAAVYDIAKNFRELSQLWAEWTNAQRQPVM